MPLRPYQQEALEAVVSNRAAGVPRQLIVLPTASGKMVIAANLPAALPLKGQLVFMAHRNELVQQATDKMARLNPGLRVSMDRAFHKADMNADIIVASVPTIGKLNEADPDLYSERLKLYNPERIEVVMVDEAHRIADNETFLQPLRYFRVYKEDNPDESKLLVGWTATPSRTDGIGLETVFDKIVFSRNIREMVDAGWLAAPHGYRVETYTDLNSVRFSRGDFATGELERTVNTPERNQLIVEKYRELGGGKPAIAFTVDVQHSHDLAAEFRRAGISALPLSGTTPEEERGRILAALASKETSVVCSCGVLNEGVDVPVAQVGLMASPTASGLLYRQRIGRLLRLHPAPEEGTPIKTTATIIDFCDLSTKHRLMAVPTLFGLRPDFDLKGQSAVEAVKEIEEAQSAAGQLKLTGFRTLEELRSIVEKIDLLQVEVPDLVRQHSRFSWIESATDSYTLSVPKGPTLSIRQNALGGFDLHSLDNGRRHVMISVDTLPNAFERADAMVPADARRLLALDAGWRNGVPSDKQIMALARLDRELFSSFGRDMAKFAGHIRATCTKGQVSMMIQKKAGDRTR